VSTFSNVVDENDDDILVVCLQDIHGNVGPDGG